MKNINVKRRQVMMTVLAVLMVVAMMPSMVFAADFSVDHDRISIGAGEPLEITWAGTNSANGTVTATNESYYPGTFTLYVQNANGAPAITSGSGTVTFAYDAEENNKAYIVNINSAATITVNLKNATANSGVYTLTCSAPHGTKPSAALPTAVNGYLPVGQFARGEGWGSLFTDGTNLTGTTKKFLDGYTSTGVSLGAAGGYVEFGMRVNNDPTNPYGVDFIVYGNAFKGNPEAASVKVYGFKHSGNTGGKWYELAGSLYYDNITQRNKDVSYKKISTGDKAGIYYQMTNHGGNLDANKWTKFNTNTSIAWWPEDSEGYNSVWGSVPDVVKTDNIITYKNISLVKDTDTTGDYQFGYADVHINGSDYGTAINPYDAKEDSKGGDGFDLAWAVDENGNPVVLDHITKVRVYTSAAMKADGSGLFTNPSIFGETSAEVCGIYGVNGIGDGDTTLNPTITCGNTTLTTTNKGIVEHRVNAGTYAITVSNGGSNTYINSAKSMSNNVTVAVGETKLVRVISQEGSASPYLTIIKIIGQ